MTAPRFFALIPAAGVGARMAAAGPKQYLELAGKTMLRHVVDTFAAAAAIAHCYVVVSTDDAYVETALAGTRLHATVLRHGGATRCDTVCQGLLALRETIADDDWVLVHDAARPGLTVALIARLIAQVRDDAVGGLLALPVVDTLKRADEAGRSCATVSRAQLWAAQTPQMFRYGLLLRALQAASGGSASVTDEASAVEALGLQPLLVEGSARNFKVTLPHDIVQAAFYLKESE